MTTAIPSAKTQFWLSLVANGPTTVTPTAISAAKPAVVTVANTAGIVKGSVVRVSGTNFPELDGKTFLVGTVDGAANTFELMGSDTSGSTAVLGTTPVVNVYTTAGNMTKFCVSSFSREAGQSDTVSVGTFCDPSATIAGTSSAGTASFAGYMDPTEEGYLELLRAVDDRKERLLHIVLPDGKGDIILRGVINSFSEDFTLGNAISWTSGMALATNPTYIWP
jgi:hypothetical protein